MEAQTCIVENGERRVELTEKALKKYENEHIFRNQPLLLLPATLIHENQHVCGKKHEVDQNSPDFYQLSTARFSNRIAEYNSLKDQRSEQQNADFLDDLFSDPTFLEYLLEVYL